ATGLFMYSCDAIEGLTDGDISAEDLDNAIEETNKAAKKAELIDKYLRDDFTDKERYYVGRSTCAYVFSNYELIENEELTLYLNQVGTTMALASNRYATFNGYRFVAFDDEHPNAYGTPGGMILISTGLLELCENEDELAAVLAHEVEHVVKDHPMKAVSKETKKAALLNLAKYYAQKELEKQEDILKALIGGLTDSFGSIISDIMDSLDNGYERETEYEADSGAIMTIQRAGYSVEALKTIIDKLPGNKEESNYGSNHPTNEDRIMNIEENIQELGISIHPILEKRTNRFNEMMTKTGIK
ncbi:MAG: M48 family metallopeptidase, partial [Spirochaetota bacterium]